MSFMQKYLNVCLFFLMDCLFINCFANRSMIVSDDSVSAVETDINLT